MTVAVIGGGLQGCGVALELAMRGLKVDLFDRAPRVLQGASRHSEGKIHLGYVYAGDDTMKTARLMAAGAAAFLPTLHQWLGDNPGTFAFSTPFRYAIHRNSALSVDELGSRYRVISRIVHSAFRDHPMTSSSQAAHLCRVEEGDSWAYTSEVVQAYQTSEVAIDTDILADAVAAAVDARPEIRTICRANVIEVDRRARRLSFVLDRAVRRSCAYDHIVNCSWDSLPTIDATAGVFSDRPWSHRVKYFVRLGSTDTVPPLTSTTFVLGQFGDVVNFGPHGSYLSWYPAGRTNFTTGLTAPIWNPEPPLEQATTIFKGIVKGLSSVMPAIATLSCQAGSGAAVSGGVVLAHGDTDLDDKSTELHQRHSIGAKSSDNYHSVNTGKLTMAPYFAVQVADIIRPAR